MLLNPLSLYFVSCHTLCSSSVLVIRSQTTKAISDVSGSFLISLSCLQIVQGIDLYRVLVKELAQILERQFAENAKSRAAGIVINTMGFIHGLGYDEYFYGLSNDLSPNSSIANFSDLAIYKIGGGPQAPASALPIGAHLLLLLRLPRSRIDNDDK
ncbi:protein CLP1 [Tanacetum coccineum]